MPSPFPGMDPYLESPVFWSDFHSRFINAWCESIADRLPDDYEARIGERISLSEGMEGPERQIEPDIALHRSSPATPGDSATAVAVMPEPVTIPLIILDEARQAYIEILRRPERSLVAVLELLSPANKSGSGRVTYLDKRNALIFQDIHMFEFDLLLGGRRLMLRSPLPPGDYYAFLSRADRRPDCQVYVWTIRQPLPTLPIPLKDPDPDIWINLAAVFATAYERGRYARALAYGEPPSASMREEDRDWARDLGRTMRT